MSAACITDLTRANDMAVDMGYLYYFNVKLDENVENRTFYLEVKEKPEATSSLLLLTTVTVETDTGIYVHDEATGFLTVRINSADSDDLARPGLKYFEMWSENGAEKELWVQGRLEFSRGALA